MDSIRFSQTHGDPLSWSAAECETSQILASFNPTAPFGAPAVLLVPVRGGGRVAVQVHRTVADGLLVHRAVGLPGWRLTHHSGRSIAGFEYRWQALLAAVYLERVADWRYSPSALRADTAALIADVDAGVRKAGGVLLVTPGGVADRVLSARRAPTAVPSPCPA
ncbi:hypothetical protein ACSNOH_13325 [Streptomyces sp. URMC 127]|uniref:hypothetical protein n=1 Tax=Streptomyces sp. URMC 127 TaxID=3423402 RepID=UPI003F1BAB7F